VKFTHGCKQRGLRVLIDLVVNHTSNEHPWFQAARCDPQSKYRDWFVWSKKKPKNAASGVDWLGGLFFYLGRHSRGPGDAIQLA
jgi:maltose alpha-D-glucosyltransferase/alpha-amylase